MARNRPSLVTGPISNGEIADPAATQGFEFLEFTAPEPAELHKALTLLGFRAVAHHRSKQVTLYRQGGINFIVNAEPGSRAEGFAGAHGPSACAMGFRVNDARRAFEAALARGAKPAPIRVGPMELHIPAIEGIGGALIYLIDDRRPVSIYDIDFEFDAGPSWPAENNAGLVELDHLTHDVEQGRMDYWAAFYERVFNFKELQYFEIEGTASRSNARAMVGPCGKIRIPITEACDDQSQTQEFIRRYRGEGVQHIALATDDICATVDKLKANGVTFMPPPLDTYYEALDARVGPHGEDVEALKSRGILLDGFDGKFLLQIFTSTLIGPIFFEIIQRKGDEGFGAGNVKALYESVERDQMRRGSLKR